ncbi:MAG: hypothetical protein ACR2IT_03505, partial [Pirellulales bacterium]
MTSFFEYLPISRRLFLISVAYTLPIAVLLYFVVNGINQDIRFSELEKIGNFYQRPLALLLEHVPQHALAARRALDGKQPQADSLIRERSEIDRAFAVLREVDARHATDLQFTGEGLAKRDRTGIDPATVQREWEALKQGAGATTAAASDEAHGKLLERILLMIKHVGDTSNLILDPDLDSYYLMDVTLLALPETQRRYAEALGMFEALTRRPALDADDRVKLAVLGAQFAADVGRIAADVDTVRVEDPNFYGTEDRMQAGLQPGFKRYDAAAQPVVQTLASLGTDAKTVADGAAIRSLIGQTETARNSSFAFWRDGVDWLDALLDKRIA